MPDQDRPNHTMKSPSNDNTHPASLSEMASTFDQTDFPVWDRTILQELPSNEEWARLANPHLVTVRIAATTLTKRKDELLQMISQMKENGGGSSLYEELVPRLHETEEFFRGMLEIVEGAECRLLAAACKQAVLDGFKE